MRNVRKNIATRQVIHIVGEGLTELFYFSHLKKFLGYRYSISPRLFENNSIEKIDKKIKELLNEDVFVICVFDADVSRRSDAEKRNMRRMVMLFCATVCNQSNIGSFCILRILAVIS